MDKFKKKFEGTPSKLELSFMKTENIRFLSQFLETSITLEKLIITHTLFSPDDLQLLSESLEKNKSLKTLELFKNEIEDMTCLFESLQKNKSLIQLELSDNRVKKHTPLPFEILQKTNISCLNLYNCYIDDLILLEKNTILTSVTLINVNLEFEILASILKKNKTLIELYLNCNDIKSNNCKILSKSLRHNDTLELLSLWNNDISNEGCKFLCKALKNNTTLTNLDIGCNNIDDEGMKFLFELFTKNKIIKYLNLGTNFFNEQGQKLLLKIFEQNYTLTHVHMINTHISDSNYNLLYEYLQRNQQIYDKKKSLLLCMREYPCFRGLIGSTNSSEYSVFHKNHFPLDLFKIIYNSF